MAGKNQNNLSFNYDLVNYSSNKQFKNDDIDGQETIDVLKNLKKLLQILNSNDESSLGLHPMIYFYSKNGNFKPAMFYATFLFVKKLKETNKFNLFISNRAKMEEFIYHYDGVFDQINRNLRSSKKSASVLCDVLFGLIEDFQKDKCVDEIINSLIGKFNVVIDLDIMDEPWKRSELKSTSFISTALPSVPKCSICGGAVHTNSISMDHIVRKRDGGEDSVKNVQITHPYCNTGYKN